MIKFEGSLSGKCKDVVLKEYTKSNLLYVGMVLITGVPAAIGISNFFEWWTLLISLPCVLLMCAMIIVNIVKGQSLPAYIQISNGSIHAKYRNGEYDWSFDDVSSVDDIGEWYVINMPNVRPIQKLVCQKDLLTQGTLEDFESLFVTKIIRKI